MSSKASTILGSLSFEPVEEYLALVAAPTKAAIVSLSLKGIKISAIDPNLADTRAFCEHYKIKLEESVNCVIVEAKRATKISYAACLIQASKRIDVNSKVRRYLDARKISFASMEKAILLSGMEYGGITPIGLPKDCVVLVDQTVMQLDKTIIGSGLRGSKLLVDTKVFGHLPGATVLDLTKLE